jgi:hypothetical protein
VHKQPDVEAENVMLTSHGAAMVQHITLISWTSLEVSLTLVPFEGTLVSLGQKYHLEVRGD